MFNNRHRRDKNAKQIIDGLRSAGALVKDTSQLSEFVDCVVGFRGATFLLEIKRKDVSPSQKKLTQAEQRFHSLWGDYAHIVESLEEAMLVVGMKPKIKIK